MPDSAMKSSRGEQNMNEVSYKQLQYEELQVEQNTEYKNLVMTKL